MSKSGKDEVRQSVSEAARKPSASTLSPVLSGQPKASPEPTGTARVTVRLKAVKETPASPNTSAVPPLPTTRVGRRTAITEAWLQAISPEAFQWALEELGFVLARGDHDSLSVVDRDGNPFNLANQVEGMSSPDLRTWLADLLPTLPTLDDAKANQKAKRRSVKQTRNVVKRVAIPAHAPKPPRSRSGSDTRKKSIPVTTRYDAEELKALDDAASAAGLTRAAYQRRQCLDMEPKTRSIRRPSIEVAEVAKLTAQLGKIGSNMNQIARAANMGKTLSGLLDAELAELRELRPLLFRALERKA